MTISRPALLILTTLACSIATPACAAAQDEDAAASTSGIRRGEDTDEHPEVGILLPPISVCTATLIRPRIVLTAARCVTEARGAGPEPTGLVTGNFIFRVHGVDDMVGIDRYARKRDRVGNMFATREDVAVVRLTSAPRGVTPASLATRAPESGDVLTAVGYGRSDCGTVDIWNGGSPSTSATKRKRDYEWGGPVYVTCPGDSGGPHFGVDGSVYAVSSGSGVLGNTSATVAANRAWLDEAIAELER